MIRRVFVSVLVAVMAFVAVISGAFSVADGDVVAVRAAPERIYARVSLTVSSGLLAISPDGAASVYEDTSSAVLVGAGRTRTITVNAASRGSAPVAAQMLEASAAKHLTEPTLVMVDPDRASAVGTAAPASLGVALPSDGSVQAWGATKYLPVILVHGTWSNTESAFGPLLPALEAAGIPAFTYNYGRIEGLPINLLRGAQAGGESPIEDSTQRLAQEIARVLDLTGAKKVNLIGSSQGGLIIKNYLAHAEGNYVANVVDINATNHGTTLNGPGKLLDPAIVEEAFAPIHAVITGVTDTVNRVLQLAGPLKIIQGPVALFGSAAHFAAEVAQAIVKIPVVAVQKLLRLSLSLVIGPAAVQQAVGSDFLNHLNNTQDTKPGVNYLTLGSKNDTTATPYNTTFLKASGGSAVINLEEHSLPGVGPTDVIGHADLPPPVVDAIVRFLTAADSHPKVDAKIDRSAGITITEDGGTTTVRSGENKIFYQGPSDDGTAIKRAIRQALNTPRITDNVQTSGELDTDSAAATQTLSMHARYLQKTAGLTSDSMTPASERTENKHVGADVDHVMSSKDPVTAQERGAVHAETAPAAAKDPQTSPSRQQVGTPAAADTRRDPVAAGMPAPRGHTAPISVSRTAVTEKTGQPGSAAASKGDMGKTRSTNPGTEKTGASRTTPGLETSPRKAATATHPNTTHQPTANSNPRNRADKAPTKTTTDHGHTTHDND